MGTSARRVRRSTSYAILGAMLLVALLLPAGGILAAGTAFYVDCAGGTDTASGTAPDRAWRTMARANAAPLTPGDRLLLRRGCTWVGPLNALWNGTPAQPVTIGAYGSGGNPRLYNSSTSDEVHVNGTYQTIQDLDVGADPPGRDPGCANQPVGWTVGFGVYNDHNTVQRVKASGLTAGVHLAGSANTILNGTFVDNIVLSQNSASSSSGAWGILVNGSDNEIAYSYLSGNNAWCSYQFGQEGASIELYGAPRNRIHHNISVNDTTFTELGGDGTTGNAFYYNKYVDTAHDRTEAFNLGGGRSTAVYNNSIYLTGGDSRGLVVGTGDGGTVVKNNIFYVNARTAWAGGWFNEGNNLYWSGSGAPNVNFEGFAMAGTSRKADPLFADDLQLRTGSPAIGSGTAESVQRGYITDLAGRAVYAAVVDIGAYTYPPATPPPSRLPPATPFPPALPPPPPSRFAPVSPSGLSARAPPHGR